MVNGFFHPYLGGTEKHMYEIGRRIAKKEEVHVLTSLLPESKEEEELDGVHVHRVKTKFHKMPTLYPPPYPRSPEARKAIEKLDKKYDFDFINLHSRWFPDFAYSFFYGKKRGKINVFTLHNGRPIGINPAISFAGSLFDTLYGKKVLSLADKIIAVSDAVGKDISHYNCIDKEKIVVQHNGVNTSFFKPSPPTYREAHGDPDNVVLFLGRMIKQKGLKYFLKAIPYILKEHKKTIFIMAGTGNERKKLIAKAKSMKLGRNVLFPGFIPEEDLPSLYSSADVYVLPSLWEVCPLTLLEAMACGVPCVVSDAGGNSEVIENGKCGFVVPKKDYLSLAEKINLLLSDGKLRKQMSKKARERAVKFFDWDIIAEKTRNIYLDLL